MNQIYVGKEGTKCDGNIFGYSYYMHILTSKAGIEDGDRSYCREFWDMIIVGAKHDLVKEDYTFQHKYRSKSIEFFFYKEMFWAMVVCGLS
mgnify:CR=1 FL=1